MIDHVLGRPSIKSRRLQVLAVLAFWSAYLLRGSRHGPPPVRFFSRMLSKSLTAWQTVVITMLYLYATRNFSTLVGLSSPEPLANMYDAAYFRATWVLTALDAGFWTAMKIRQKWLRDLASMVFSAFYLVSAEKADEKVRKVRSNLTVDHLRVGLNKGKESPYLSFFQGLLRPRFTRWPPRAIRTPRPTSSDYKDPVSGWLYFDGPLADLSHHDKIILDIPGGGFVAMDPRCNDDKLMAWCAKTGLPILSLDYKKAPEYPYPYALNECYDVYTTIINSRGRCLGLSGREVPKIVVTGDSAGGNLAAAMTLMIIESGPTPVQRFQAQPSLPLPDGVVLFYPTLDMNIGSWMSDAQMALIQDRRMPSTNKRIARRKNLQYEALAGTPHHSDGEDELSPKSRSTPDPSVANEVQPGRSVQSSRGGAKPEFAHLDPLNWAQTRLQSPAVPGGQDGQGTKSYHAQPLRTRLAMSSMISYSNDRVLTPEMMRAMIILYIGPHNRPDFSQDYLLSPILAPDVLLARFPKTYLVTGERDPLVDDTVVFAGRLRRVRAAFQASGGERLEYRDSDTLAEGFDEREAAEVVLIPRISHGFLQFPSIYPPAWQLIDRSAQWIVDAFTGMERARRLQRRQWRRQQRRGHDHPPRESSGDEGRPLEIGMTRARGRSLRDDKEKAGNKTDGAMAERGEAEETASGEEETSWKGGGGRAGRAMAKNKGDRSLVKLNSTDDLLGRRMHGVAGGLTGLGEDE